MTYREDVNGGCEFPTCDKDATQYEYHHTHVSVHDGSPAMMIWGVPFTLMNEDGYTWQPEPEDWELIQP